MAIWTLRTRTCASETLRYIWRAPGVLFFALFLRLLIRINRMYVVFRLKHRSPVNVAARLAVETSMLAGTLAQSWTVCSTRCRSIAFFSHVPEDLDRLSRLSVAERNAEASSLRGWSLVVSIHSSTTIAEQPLAATTQLPLTEFAVLERFDLDQALLDLSTRGDDQVGRVRGMRTVRVQPSSADGSGCTVQVFYDDTLVPHTSLPEQSQSVTSLGQLSTLLDFAATACPCKCVPPGRYEYISHLPVGDSGFVSAHFDGAAVENRSFVHVENRRLHARLLHWRAAGCCVLLGDHRSRCQHCDALHARVKSWHGRGVPAAVDEAARQHSLSSDSVAARSFAASLAASAVHEQFTRVKALISQFGCADLLVGDTDEEAHAGAAAPAAEDTHGVPDNELVLLLVAVLRCGTLPAETTVFLRDVLKQSLLRAAGKQKRMRWSTATVAFLLKFTKRHGNGALQSLERLGFPMPTVQTLLAYVLTSFVGVC